MELNLILLKITKKFKFVNFAWFEMSNVKNRNYFTRKTCIAKVIN